jgi:hypothetical protein
MLFEIGEFQRRYFIIFGLVKFETIIMLLKIVGTHITQPQKLFPHRPKPLSRLDMFAFQTTNISSLAKIHILKLAEIYIARLICVDRLVLVVFLIVLDG